MAGEIVRLREVLERFAVRRDGGRVQARFERKSERLLGGRGDGGGEREVVGKLSRVLVGAGAASASIASPARAWSSARRGPLELR